MLTGNLLTYARRKGKLYPQWLEPAAEIPRETAEAVLGLFGAHGGRRRGELEQALRDAAPPGRPGRLFQGLAKLLLERSEFEVPGQTDPPALRAALFDSAAEKWRTGDGGPPSQWRPEIVARVAAAQGISTPEAEAALYADLAENQLLLRTRAFTPEALIYRYNVAQVQGLLLRATHLTLRSPPVPARRLRQLFRYLQFFGLLFQVHSQGEEGLELVLDGPLSLLEHNNRYGLNLAQFFPVLLLWETPWELTATLVPKAGGGEAALTLGPHPLLRSHYPDQGQWVPPELRRFQQGFQALDGPWSVAPAEVILPLPGNRCLVPDLEFRRTHPPGRMFLEFLPYPIADKARQRLAWIGERGGKDYLLACRGIPAVEELAETNRALCTFRRTLLPGKVSERLEEMAADAG